MSLPDLLDILLAAIKEAHAAGRNDEARDLAAVMNMAARRLAERRERR